MVDGKNLPGIHLQIQVDWKPGVAYPVLLGNIEAVTLNTYYRITQEINNETRMSANAQRDGRPVKYRWRPLFNATKFG